ncbi:MAG: hypothetical protein LBH02_02980 [Methanocalculaceae archaeon]|jgi:hypothetical protein|nr:hypothetical protein [Methanocalculaceae archaeon]
MSERRTLTIGVAINIGNCESLRLEVSDCVQTEEDAAELAAYINHVLDGYGQNDATIRASIDKYRIRVLEKHVPKVSISSPPNPHGEQFDPITVFDGMTINEECKTLESVKIGEITEISELVHTKHEIAKVEETPKMQGSVIAEPDPAKIEGKSTLTIKESTTYICEKCGVSVSKVQRDVSNLFMGKTFCKICMK